MGPHKLLNKQNGWWFETTCRSCDVIVMPRSNIRVYIVIFHLSFSEFTHGGNALGGPCHWPYLYNGIKYASCIEAKADQSWCSVTASYSINKVWGYCSPPENLSKFWLSTRETQHGALSRFCGSSTQRNRNKHLITRLWGLDVGYLVLCLSHITLPGPVRAVPGLFWTKIVHPRTGPAWAPCGAARFLPPRTGPVEF